MTICELREVPNAMSFEYGIVRRRRKLATAYEGKGRRDADHKKAVESRRVDCSSAFVAWNVGGSGRTRATAGPVGYPKIRE